MVDQKQIDIMRKKIDITRLDVAIGEAELKLINIQNEIAIVEESLTHLNKKKQDTVDELNKLKA